MAIDVCLLDWALQSEPVLRLYGFKPSCLSIGLNQSLPDEVIQRVGKEGFDLVRRPSGGRAVLHHFDLTYAFVAAELGRCPNGVLGTSVAAAYKQICEGLTQAFLRLGISAELGARSQSYRNLSDCFQATTNADLHVEGLKLAGSAQLRRKGAVLQHGSIPLSLDQALVGELLSGEEHSIERDTNSKPRHANLFELIGRHLEYSELETAMKQGFEAAFGISFEEVPLTDEELSNASSRKDEFRLLERSV